MVIWRCTQPSSRRWTRHIPITSTAPSPLPHSAHSHSPLTGLDTLREAFMCSITKQAITATATQHNDENISIARVKKNTKIMYVPAWRRLCLCLYVLWKYWVDSVCLVWPDAFVAAPGEWFHKKITIHWKLRVFPTFCHSYLCLLSRLRHWAFAILCCWRYDVFDSISILCKYEMHHMDLWSEHNRSSFPFHSRFRLFYHAFVFCSLFKLSTWTIIWGHHPDHDGDGAGAVTIVILSPALFATNHNAKEMVMWCCKSHKTILCRVNANANWRRRKTTLCTHTHHRNHKSIHKWEYQMIYLLRCDAGDFISHRFWNKHTNEYQHIMNKIVLFVSSLNKWIILILHFRKINRFLCILWLIMKWEKAHHILPSANTRVEASADSSPSQLQRNLRPHMFWRPLSQWAGLTTDDSTRCLMCWFTRVSPETRHPAETHLSGGICFSIQRKHKMKAPNES